MAQIAAAMTWAPHTLRGFFAGLKKRRHRSHCGGTRASGRAEQGRRWPATPSTAAPRSADAGAIPNTTRSGSIGSRPWSRATAGSTWTIWQASARAFVAAQDWTLVAEFSDIASGKDDRRPGFQAALTRRRQLGAVLVAARLDRITRRAYTLSQLLEDGYSIRAADMPGADVIMMRIYAAMAQKERELISERTKAALAAARARGKALGGDRGYRPSVGPDSCAARRCGRRWLIRPDTGLPWKWRCCAQSGIRSGTQGLARALSERGVPTPRGGNVWTHTTVARLLAVRPCSTGRSLPVNDSRIVEKVWHLVTQGTDPLSMVVSGLLAKRKRMARSVNAAVRRDHMNSWVRPKSARQTSGF